MINRVPAKYRLLVGPYRSALWAVLCRFKGRCVGGFVDTFLGQGFEVSGTALTKAHAAAMRRARDHFLDMQLTFQGRIEQHRQLLTQSFKDLVAQANVDDRIGLRALDPEAAAHARVEHLERYITATSELWCELDQRCLSLVENPRPADAISFKRKLYRAVEQSLWPYYGVVYKRRTDVVLPGANSEYNFCSWVPNSELLSVSFAPDGAAPIPNYSNNTESNVNRESPDSDLLLYPSVTNDTLSDGVLAQFLDAASEASFDFDSPFRVAGHVQVLTDPSQLDCSYRQLDKVFAHGLSAIDSPFTDLFYFVNDVFRSIIVSKSEIDPSGVLFLATPCLDALQAILSVDETSTVSLRTARLIRTSWDAVGGSSLSRIFRNDFDRLRSDLFPALARESQLTAYQSIGHTMNSLVRITGWQEAYSRLNTVRRALKLRKEGDPPPDQHAILDAVDRGHRALGMFLLPQSLLDVVASAADGREQNWRKMRQWIGSDGGEWTTNNIECVCTAYAQSVFYLARCICMGDHPIRWDRLLVECASAAPPWKAKRWDGEHEEWPDNVLDSLHFPPFRQGTDAAYLFVVALAEPICNAVSALGRLDPRPENVDLALRITIAPDLDSRTMKITVSNVGETEINARLPGLEKTKYVLDEFGLARFEPYASQPIEDTKRLFRVSTSVTFHPFELHKRIADYASSLKSQRSQ